MQLFFLEFKFFIFLREATQNDHIRLLYKFENDQKKIGCVGSCGYAPASVKDKIDIFLTSYVHQLFSGNATIYEIFYFVIIFHKEI